MSAKNPYLYVPCLYYYIYTNVNRYSRNMHIPVHLCYNSHLYYNYCIYVRTLTHNLINYMYKLNLPTYYCNMMSTA